MGRLGQNTRMQWNICNLFNDLSQSPDLPPSLPPFRSKWRHSTALNSSSVDLSPVGVCIESNSTSCHQLGLGSGCLRGI